MGLFDKVKAIKNAITGGGAEVELTSTSAVLGEQFEITVSAHVKDADIKINRVYIKMEGREEIEVPYTDSDSDNDSYSSRSELVRSSSPTFELEINAGEPQILSANEKYKWKVMVELPEDALPIYKGNYCRHIYRACGFLDCLGNDPDSGWQTLSVK